MATSVPTAGPPAFRRTANTAPLGQTTPPSRRFSRTQHHPPPSSRHHPCYLPRPQAKDLVEAAPCTIMTKVKAEEAAKIMEKLKAETGGEFELI